MTLEEDFGQFAREAHPKTFADLHAAKPYVHCPQCAGSGQVYAYWDLETQDGDYIDCPCCGATKEASDEKAIAWLERQRDRNGWDQ